MKTAAMNNTDEEAVWDAYMYGPSARAIPNAMAMISERDGVRHEMYVVAQLVADEWYG